MAVIFFHPFLKADTVFPAAEGKREYDAVESWRKAEVGRIVYQDTAKAIKEKLFEDLLDAADVLYIIGQCTAGHDELFSIQMNGKIPKAKISLDGVVKQLDGLLSYDFAGRVKVFACYSGVDGKSKKSFADQFAGRMKGFGWVECKYVGYDDQISTFATKEPKGDASLTDTTDQHKWGFSDNKRVKFHQVKL